MSRYTHKCRYTQYVRTRGLVLANITQFPIKKIPVGKDDYPVALTDNLWALGNYYFNLYLVQGKNTSAIIEVGTSGVVDSVIMQLELLNISPSYLIITHPHADHVTGLKGLMERYPDARVVAGQGAKEFITHPKAIEVMVKEDIFMSGRLASIGFNPGRPPLAELPFPESHMVVNDDIEIDLGGIVLHCKNVRGHAPGSILIHVPAVGALALSDSMGFHYPGRGFLPLFLADYRGYMETLDYMISLKPEILCFGHQGPLIGSNVDNAFKVSRQAALNMFSRVTDERRDGNDLAEEIFRECYKDEFMMYTEENIRSVAQLLVSRARESVQ